MKSVLVLAIAVAVVLVIFPVVFLVISPVLVTAARVHFFLWCGDCSVVRNKGKGSPQDLFVVVLAFFPRWRLPSRPYFAHSLCRVLWISGSVSFVRLSCTSSGFLDSLVSLVIPGRYFSTFYQSLFILHFQARPIGTHAHSRVIDLDLQGQIWLKSTNLPHFECVRTITLSSWNHQTWIRGAKYPG